MGAIRKPRDNPRVGHSFAFLQALPAAAGRLSIAHELVQEFDDTPDCPGANLGAVRCRPPRGSCPCAQAQPRRLRRRFAALDLVQYALAQSASPAPRPPERALRTALGSQPGRAVEGVRQPSRGVDPARPAVLGSRQQRGRAQPARARPFPRGSVRPEEGRRPRGPEGHGLRQAAAAGQELPLRLGHILRRASPDREGSTATP